MAECKIKIHNPQLDCSKCQNRTCEGATPILRQALTNAIIAEIDPNAPALTQAEIDAYNAYNADIAKTKNTGKEVQIRGW